MFVRKEYFYEWKPDFHGIKIKDELKRTNTIAERVRYEYYIEQKIEQDVPKLAKTTAERVREYRLRQKLKSQLYEKEECDSSSSPKMKPPHAKTNAERLEELRLRKTLERKFCQENECDSSTSDKMKPKRAKTAAERMREFRLRQKLKYQRCEEEECDSNVSNETKVKLAATSLECDTEFRQCKKLKSEIANEFQCGTLDGIRESYQQKDVNTNPEEQSKLYHCKEIKFEIDKDSVEHEVLNINKINSKIAKKKYEQKTPDRPFGYKQALNSDKIQYLPHSKAVHSNYQKNYKETHNIPEVNSSRLPFGDLKGLCLETSTHPIIVPPHFTDEITFTFDSAKASKVSLPELKSDESEEIEIVPDIHIADDGCPSLENDLAIENEYLGIKLKNFSNIHYQVISTPAAKLNDVHMILYLTTSAQNNIRRNVLEFSGYPFDESSTEYQCRRNLMEQMSLDDLKTVATVLCVSQYIVDESKNSLIDAILKFLLKPSALLNSSTIMPTISPAPISRRSPVVKKKATSTSKTPQLSDILPEIVISEVKTLASDKEIPSNSVNNAAISSSNAISTEDSSLTSTPEFKKMTASLSNDIQIMPLPKTGEVKEEPIDADEPLSKVKSTVSIVPVRVPYVGSDDEDDKPLSKMIGHPNDDQLRLLVTKIVKESKLEDITMKTVIRKVFDAYPNFDLGYRKEFIKSIVRQILSQMDDQSCSVTTTVITI